MVDGIEWCNCTLTLCELRAAPFSWQYLPTNSTYSWAEDSTSWWWSYLSVTTYTYSWVLGSAFDDNSNLQLSHDYKYLELDAGQHLYMAISIYNWAPEALVQNNM